MTGEVAFYQWIDGSFINLNSFPNDLDVVTFLPAQTYQSIQKNLKLLYQNKEKFSLLDLYFVEIVPISHKNFLLYQSDKFYWHHLFSYSKINLT